MNKTKWKAKTATDDQSEENSLKKLYKLRYKMFSGLNKGVPVAIWH